ncbi:MAG: heme-binding protein [Phycisphaerales bacterium]
MIQSSRVWSALAAGASMAMGLGGCSEPGKSERAAAAPAESPTASAPAPASSTGATAVVPPPAEPARSAVERTKNGFRWGTAKINTPLPEGYPDPTAPGDIEIKSYPLVRRAEVTGKAGVNSGMDGAFWPLFRHIQRRDIEMTSPVEMDYKGLTSDASGQPDEWTMSFLYRTPELGPLGEDTSSKRHTVRINDLEPMTVASIGFQGPYRVEVVKMNLAKLEAWLAAQPQWERDGEPRALFYNGPEQWESRKWGEVQVPVKRVTPPSDEPTP